MRPLPAHELVPDLDPPSDARLKEEPGTWIWRAVAHDGTPVIAKLYRRRTRWSTLRCRLTSFRAEREFDRLEHLARLGVPCTQPTGWARGWCELHGHYELLVTGEIPGAVSLEQYLHDDACHLDLAPLLRVVQQLHDAGICHHALYARNVLVKCASASEPSYFLCDLPRSFRFPKSIAGSRAAFDDISDLLASVAHHVRRGSPLSAGKAALAFAPAATRCAAHGGRKASKPVRFYRDLRLRVVWLAAWMIFWANKLVLPVLERL